MSNCESNREVRTEPFTTTTRSATDHNEEGALLGHRHGTSETADVPSNEAEEWISTPLHPWCVCVFIAFGISLIAAIIVLLVLSLRRQGFVTVGTALSAHHTLWRLSLLWTSLPSFIFTCLGLYWGAIANAASDRQPFVGLNRPHGGPAKETVLLDYRSIISLIKWLPAFRNGHHQVAWAQLAALVFTILSPLAANLFVASEAFFQQDVPILFNSTFDQGSLNNTMDIRVVLDAAAATLVYGASDRPWTNHQYAFRPFYTDFQVTGAPPPTNTTALTARTVAYSGYLDCAVLSPGADYNITSTSDPSSPSGAELVMTGTDRGCPVRQEFTVDDLQQVYFLTTSQPSCGIAAQYSRLVFTYAHFSAAGAPFLANTSVVSCAPLYRRTAGDLRVTVPNPRDPTTPGGDKPQILGFSPSQPPQDARDDSFGFWVPFESLLFQSEVFSAGTTWATTDFGTVAMYRALQRQGGWDGRKDNSTVLGGEVLAASVVDVFTSVYLTAMATAGLDPLGGAGGPQGTTARLETRLTRLFVVPWVAGTIIGVLGVILVVAGWVLVYVERHKTLLYEEPAGLLAYAGLLEGSELIEVARRVRNSEGFDGKVGETVLRNANGEGKEKGERGSKKGKGPQGEVVGDCWKMTAGIKPQIIITPKADDDAAGRMGSTGGNSIV
ncbi:hypothetical protein C8A05DRAFT_33253 [Staphylotrichum tortipilum]|uniref:Uncharacterized protein n=1 Tax=Staphylotrichum tortipilum TaxID=2831512 RepID=A0AAN6MNB6_9PEZI|nr:hypothetical protein C8A05DRAFT_33253 [Staphylotrichum longicolle]